MMRLIVLSVVTALATASPVARKRALPDVENVLQKATEKMASFAQKAADMEARAAQRQEDSKKALAAERQMYEDKLAEQAKQNDAVLANITALQTDVLALKKSNNQTLLQLRQVSTENRKIYNVLGAVHAKVDAATLFLEDSIQLTSDDDVQELAVLTPEKPQATLENFLRVASSKLPEVQLLKPKGQALLQVPERRTPDEAAPESYVDKLSLSLTDISAAEKEGRAQLEASFQSSFQAGEKLHAELTQTADALVGNKANLTASSERLNTAKTHLEATRQQLKVRLQGMRAFAFKIDEILGKALKNGQDTMPAMKTSSFVRVPAGSTQQNQSHVRPKQNAGLAGKLRQTETRAKPKRQ